MDISLLRSQQLLNRMNHTSSKGSKANKAEFYQKRIIGFWFYLWKQKLMEKDKRLQKQKSNPQCFLHNYFLYLLNFCSHFFSILDVMSIHLKELASNFLDKYVTKLLSLTFTC